MPRPTLLSLPPEILLTIASNFTPPSPPPTPTTTTTTSHQSQTHTPSNNPSPPATTTTFTSTSTSTTTTTTTTSNQSQTHTPSNNPSPPATTTTFTSTSTSTQTPTTPKHPSPPYISLARTHPYLYCLLIPANRFQIPEQEQRVGWAWPRTGPGEVRGEEGWTREDEEEKEGWFERREFFETCLFWGVGFEAVVQGLGWWGGEDMGYGDEEEEESEEDEEEDWEDEAVDSGVWRWGNRDGAVVYERVGDEEDMVWDVENMGVGGWGGGGDEGRS